MKFDLKLTPKIWSKTLNIAGISLFWTERRASLKLSGRKELGVFVDRREASVSGTSQQRDDWGPNWDGPDGCGQDFRFYSRNREKPLVGIKQGQDMV